MTDKELLELAAKAAGEIPKSFYGNENYLNGVLDRWNPLDDDGQALRLAVKLHMEIDHNHPADQSPWVTAQAQGSIMCMVEEFDDESEREEATRRAIVRAAAEIGKNI